jgi:hypothetical protein
VKQNKNKFGRQIIDPPRKTFIHFGAIVAGKIVSSLLLSRRKAPAA